MTCRLGRSIRDQKHPTCRSCQKQKIPCPIQAVAKERKTAESWPVVDEKGKRLVCTFDLQSLNKHVNKAHGDRIYRGFKKTWQRLLGYRVDRQGQQKGTQAALLLFGAHQGRSRKLTVVRYISSKRSSMDETNLQGAVKPIEDTLVLAGVLKDDTKKWLTRDILEEIDKKNPRVEISVE